METVATGEPRTVHQHEPQMSFWLLGLRDPQDEDNLGTGFINNPYWRSKADNYRMGEVCSIIASVFILAASGKTPTPTDLDLVRVS